MKMSYRQCLGYAFKHWSLEHCNRMIELHPNTLGSKVAEYVKKHKYQPKSVYHEE